MTAPHPAPDARPFAELRAVADEYAGKARRWEADLDRPGDAGAGPGEAVRDG